MSLEGLEMECERRACLAREHSRDKAILCDNLFTSDELYLSLRERSGGAFTASKFEAQRKGAIIVEMIDKEFWDKMRHIHGDNASNPRALQAAFCQPKIPAPGPL